MADREKVTYGLRCLCYGDTECKECPYAKDGSGWYGCRSNCAEDAIALLKEQECKSCGTVFDIAYKAGKESIIRCKDCKHFEMPQYGELGLCKAFGTVRKTIFYCADGERKL